MNPLSDSSDGGCAAPDTAPLVPSAPRSSVAAMSESAVSPASPPEGSLVVPPEVSRASPRERSLVVSPEVRFVEPAPASSVVASVEVSRESAVTSTSVSSPAELAPAAATPAAPAAPAAATPAAPATLAPRRRFGGGDPPPSGALLLAVSVAPASASIVCRSSAIRGLPLLSSRPAV